MTTCKVHNVKFYKLDPRGINCMSYGKKRKKLALSRSDASIEIWDLSHTPYVERTIANRQNASVEALCWFKKRLFSVGLRGTLIEYDFRTLGPKYAVPITGGVGWCMDVHKRDAKLVIGTEQGYFNLYNIVSDGVEYVKIFDKQEGRILCLKFDETGKYVASGSADTIRIWNVNNGHAIHKMSITRLADNAETVVWCLEITDNFTVISGDSRGFITFWDGELGSQIESYHSHCSSVLSICLSDDQKTVYCAGVDPVIMSYEIVNFKGKSDKWVRSISRKIHDHDVRSMVIAENKLYSGGIDGYLACSYFPPKTLVKYPPVLQNPCVAIAHDKKWLLLRYQKSLEVWACGKEAAENSGIGFLKLKEEPKKLLEIQTKGDEGTMCASISNDGQWIVYSTGTYLRLFAFLYQNDDKPELTTIPLPSEVCTCCIRAEFTPDSKQLVLAPCEGGLQVLNIEDGNIVLAQTIDTSEYLSDIISFLNISSCGNFIVIADPKSNIIIFTLTKNNWKHSGNLPCYQCPPTALGIHPKLNTLLVVYSDHEIIEYNLKKLRFTHYSRTLGNNIPQQWQSRSFPVINVSYDPQADHIVLLHDDSTICVIDKSKELPTADAKIPKLDSSSSLNYRSIKHAFHIIKKYKHLIYFGWMANGELVSVELNPLSLLEKLPPCLEQKKFGTK